MDTRTLEVEVHREAAGYWAAVRGMEGCNASGETLDELYQALREAITMYVSENQDERILFRVTGLLLEVELDLRPPHISAALQPPSRRKRQSHRDDWPPNGRQTSA
jgi:predicted RNase H-like HicB family nuclease